MRFTSPALAARCLGRFLDVAARPSVLRDADSWWVLAHIPLDLGREISELAGGVGYIRSGSSVLPDHGWGAPPTSAGPGAVDIGTLADTPLLDLVIAAGLYQRPGLSLQTAVILTSAARAGGLLQRALDLRLTATFRPLLVRPRLPSPEPEVAEPEVAAPDADEEAEDVAGTLIEVRLEVGQNRPQLPAALLTALDADRQVLVCRQASPELLVQHNRFSPLTDVQLQAILSGDRWIVADPPYGCWTFESLADYAEGWQLTTMQKCHQLTAGQTGFADPRTTAHATLPDAKPLAVVPASRADGPLDAILLDAGELRAVRLLLEGHPLAEVAVLVPGRDQFLLLAGGGIVDRIPVGRYLTRVGSEPIYIAHGWRTEPALPAAAWRSLFGGLGDRALVIEPERTLVFDLSAQRPVWELWAGELPEIDDQIPEDAKGLLAELDAETTPAPPAPRRSSPTPAARPEPETSARRGIRRFVQRLGGKGPATPVQPTWREQAWTAEQGGDLVGAARIYDVHGDSLRAARLYEWAASEATQPAPGSGPG